MDSADEHQPLASTASAERETAAGLLAQFGATKAAANKALASPPETLPSLRRQLTYESDHDEQQKQAKPGPDIFDKAEQFRGLSPSTPTADARANGSRHSLRSRESLALSAKAMDNLARGLKDPRSPTKPLQKGSSRLSAGSAAQQSSPNAHQHAIAAQVALRQRRSVWLQAHKEYFLPLLEEKNYFTKVSKASAGPDNDDTAPPSAIAFERIEKQPAGIKADLKPHQLVGLSFLVWLHKNGAAGILGDEMGLGKTLQALSLLQWIKESSSTADRGKVHLVLSPVSVVDVWRHEAAQFTPDLGVIIFQGNVTKRRQQQKLFNQDRKGERSFDIAITSYETFERDSTWFNHQSWGWVVMDEGHRVKNSETCLAMRVHALRSEHRLIMTGTPIQNNLYELWSLLKCLFKEIFSSKSATIFKDAYDLTRAGAYNASLVSASKQLLELVMLRRTKKSPEVGLSLPALEEVRLSVPLTPFQRDLYKAHVAGETTSALRNAQGGDTKDTWKRLMNLLMELRQISIHPYTSAGLDIDQNVVDPLHASGKFIVLQKLVQHHILQHDEKMIIFSCFTMVLDCVEDLLHSTLRGPGRHVEWLRIDGQTPRARRTLNIKLFQTNRKFQIILVSVRSGGTGLTLTAAKSVVFLDEDFNPMVTEQACARAHRIGQDKEVTIYKLYSKGTIEEQFLARTTKKQLLCQQIMQSFQNMNLSQDTLAEDSEQTDVEASLSVSRMWSILKSGTKSLNAAPDITVEEMLGWSMGTILETCTMMFDQDSEQSDCSGDDDDVDVSRFFQASSVTDTLLFEGMKHQRKSLRAQQTTEPVLDRSSRREGKEMVVLVDGYSVSKASLDCADGEAVATRAGKGEALQGRTRAPRAVFAHEDYCCLCNGSIAGQDEGQACAYRPRTMHAECLATINMLQTGKRSRPGNSVQCPGHECCKCGIRTVDAGGLLFRCSRCPRAYCDQHLAWELSEMVGSRLERWEGLGFDERDSMFFIHCENCSQSRKRKAAELEP